MKYATKLFCLVVAVASADAASFTSGFGIDRNAASFTNTFVFPKIPGINAPLSSFFPSRQAPARPPTNSSTPKAPSPLSPRSPPSPPSSGSPSSPPSPPPPPPPPAPGSPSSPPSPPSPPSSGSPSSPPSSGSPSSPPSSGSPSSPSSPPSSGSPSSPPSPPSPGSRPSPPSLPSPFSPNNALDLFDIPSVRSLIPNLPSSDSTSDVSVPSIPGLPDLASMAQIPGLRTAIQSARSHVQAALKIGTDIPSGIEQAIAEAFDSNNPTAAIRTIAQTILNSYVTAAQNCPLLIVGSRVLQEGIRLAGEVARSAVNVIFGSNNSTPAPQ